MSINKVTLIGLVGKDPEVRETNNAKVATFTLATSERYKDKNGDSISYRYKSTGNMVDQYITPEGKFEIVLYGKATYDNKEKKSIREFVTNDDGVYPAKSPVGMLDLYVPNDLGYIVDAVKAYYE